MDIVTASTNHCWTRNIVKTRVMNVTGTFLTKIAVNNFKIKYHQNCMSFSHIFPLVKISGFHPLVCLHSSADIRFEFSTE